LAAIQAWRACNFAGSNPASIHESQAIAHPILSPRTASCFHGLFRAVAMAFVGDDRRGAGARKHESVTAMPTCCASIYDTVMTSEPREECYDEPGTGTLRSGGDPTGGTVLGAIIGGASATRSASGDGRKAATVAGAVIGGAIERDIDKNNGSAGGRYERGGTAAAWSVSNARSAASSAMTSNTATRAKSSCRAWTTTRASAVRVRVAD
jgi:hypothetical protein